MIGIRRRLNITMATLLVVSSFMAGCGNHGDGESNRQGALLYEESYRLVKSYTDSLAKAPDSASVKRLSESFETTIAKVNFKYGADTDLEMTQQENDTLATLLDRYAKVRDSRLEQLHLAKHAVEAQTETDSVRGEIKRLAR